MLDIGLFREEETRERIKDSERKRFKDESIADEVYRLDRKWIEATFQLDNLNRKINTIQKSLNDAYKDKSSMVEETISRLRSMKIEQEHSRDELKQTVSDLKAQVSRLVFSIGNILEDEVPVCKDDSGNAVVTTHEAPGGLKAAQRGYAELMKNFVNADAGAEVVGHRGYYLQGRMALLSRALKNYAIDFLVERGYELVQVPVMMRKEVMGLTSQLSDFDEQLYKVEDDLYLIATSEQPMTALFMGKKLADGELPMMLAGESLCFRREAGAYGKDNAGIFRVHQFDKIEQFVICKPEDSKALHEKMIRTSEEFYQTLGLSYRVVLISSGEMNDAASKKYDLEAWFPNAGKFRELVSASNCTDYQSRNLNVGYGYPKAGEKQVYTHMLNATLCAVQRTLCCIVENYQDGDRVAVPDVLKPYTKFDHIDI